MLEKSRTEVRRKEQLSILNSDENIIIGSEMDLPIDINVLMDVDEEHPLVMEVHSEGLSAIVYKLNIGGCYYNLKKKRNRILVDNVDGQTSFLNEIQRRQELREAKQENPSGLEGVVNTIYANLKLGIMFSDWIEGDIIDHYNYDLLLYIFRTLNHMEQVGIFDNDPTAGNIVVRGNKAYLFDFGYAYRFDPLTDLNMEGFDEPVFHGVERFESRAFMTHLMDIEELLGLDKALEMFREEKKAAILAYKEKVEWLHANHAVHRVIMHYRAIIERWERGLKTARALKRLYQLEMFRSFLIDVVDDISGKSCTPDTRIKIRKVIEAVEMNFDYLKENDAFFWEEQRDVTVQSLLRKYQLYEEKVEKYQLRNVDGFNQWRSNRRKTITTVYH